MKNSSKTTIIVCTHNRAEILRECLTSLLPENQDADQNEYEVLVIDNNSADNTAQVVDEFSRNQDNFHYYLEMNVGLSNARNAGYKKSNSDWVAYLDDDALASRNFVSRCLYIIENYDFHMFGGMYYPWHKYGKPKWLRPDFGQKVFVRTGAGSAPRAGCISGGIMAIKKSALLKMNGFSQNYGMNGNKIAYGEENELETRMVNVGYKIGFDSKWKIDHLVAKHKLKAWWHVQSAFANARDTAFQSKNAYETISIEAFLMVFRTIAHLLIGLIRSSWKWICKKNYFRQNLILDIFQPLAIRWGHYYGRKLKHKGSNIQTSKNRIHES